MTARTRTAANCLNAAMADLSHTAADMVSNRLMLDLIERQKRDHQESMARIDALLSEYYA